MSGSLLRTKFFYVGKPPPASGTLGIFAGGTTATKSYKYNLVSDVVTLGPNPPAVTGTVATFGSAVSNSTTALFVRNRNSGTQAPAITKYGYAIDSFSANSNLVTGDGSTMAKSNASNATQGYVFFYSAGGPTVYTYADDTQVVGGALPFTLNQTFQSYAIASPTYALVGAAGSTSTRSIKYVYATDVATQGTSFTSGNTFSVAFGNNVAGHYYGGNASYVWASEIVGTSTALGVTGVSAAVGNANLAIVAQQTAGVTTRYTYSGDTVNAAASLPTGVTYASGASNGIAGVSV